MSRSQKMSVVISINVINCEGSRVLYFNQRLFMPHIFSFSATTLHGFNIQISFVDGNSLSCPPPSPPLPSLRADRNNKENRSSKVKNCALFIKNRLCKKQRGKGDSRKGNLKTMINFILDLSSSIIINRRIAEIKWQLEDNEWIEGESENTKKIRGQKIFDQSETYECTMNENAIYIAGQNVKIFKIHSRLYVCMDRKISIYILSEF